jgi:hypothetical protein
MKRTVTRQSLSGYGQVYSGRQQSLKADTGEQEADSIGRALTAMERTLNV